MTLRLALTTVGFFRPYSTGTQDPCRNLSKASLRHYLSNVHKYNREKITHDLIAIGLKPKDTADRFLEFRDHNNKVRVKIHPPDGVTDYDHMHIYNHKGKPLDKNLKPVWRKSAEAHIQIAAGPSALKLYR